MNNIELRLAVEKIRREEAIYPGNYCRKMNPMRKTVLDVMNHFPSTLPKSLNYTKLFAKN